MKYIIILLLLSNFLLAKHSIAFKELSTEDGLSNSTVNTILQDKYGYLWIGTLEGVNKYDGYNFKKFKYDREDLNSINGNRVYSLFYDKTEEIMWIGLYDGGVNKLNLKNNKITRYKVGQKNNSIVSKHVRYLFKDSRGFLWVGTNGEGLNRINTINNEIKHYLYSENNKNSISSNHIRIIFEDSKRNLWITTKGSKFVNKYDYKNDLFIRYDFGISGNNIEAITEDVKNNKLFLGTRDGSLGIVDINTKKSENLYFRKNKTGIVKESLIRSLYLEVETNLLWIGTEKGLFIYNLKDKSFEEIIDLESTHIRTIFKDKMGVLWIGTLSKGLLKLHKNSLLVKYIIHKKDNPNTIIDNVVWATYEDSKENLWISTTNGLSIFDKSNKVHHYIYDESKQFSMSESNITSILEIDEDNFWLGTYGDGINLFKKSENKFVNINKNSKEIIGLNSNYISKVFKDSKERIWIGTYDSGLNLYLKGDKSFKSFKNKFKSSCTLKSNQIRDIIETKDGKIWIATYGKGLFLFKDGKFKNYLRKFKNKVFSIDNSFYAFAYDKKNNFIWIATEAGPAIFDLKKRSFIKFNFLKSLSNKILLGVMLDNNNNLWFSSNKGLFFVKVKEEKVLSFNKKDGLLTDSFNENSYTMRKDGTLCFGGKKGAILFKNNNILINKKAAQIILTSLSVNGKKLKLKNISEVNKLNINYDDTFITFKFSLMDYLDTKKNTYQYKITGLNSKWSEFTNINQLIFPSLKSGKHNLLIRGKNSQQVLSKNEISIKIFVASPLYKKIWFITIVSITLILLIILIYIYRMASIKKANKKLSEKVKERTKELYETNEKLKKMALTDPLTNLKNRYFFKAILKEEIANFIKEKIFILNSSKRKNDANDNVMGLFMIDLDHFKHVNDKYGHDSGDMVLKQISDIFRDITRGSDAIIRWGGEEFLIILKNCNVNYLDTYAKKLIKTINQYNFKVLSGEKLIKKTCSVGYVKYPMSDTAPNYFTLEQSIAIADSALFHAKNEGRNQGVRIDLSNKVNSEEDLFKYLENLDEALKDDFFKISKITKGEK